uniref:Uncharacterized protein n=1 Tax=Rhizophora mucronata TaxID=61149 RepID=A0A2P2PL26_RHIMU
MVSKEIYLKSPGNDIYFFHQRMIFIFSGGEERKPFENMQPQGQQRTDENPLLVKSSSSKFHK